MEEIIKIIADNPIQTCSILIGASIIITEIVIFINEKISNNFKFQIMFNKKLKQKIQSLEAQVKGLIKENEQLKVAANYAKLQAESYKKAVEVYEQRMTARNSKG